MLAGPDDQLAAEQETTEVGPFTIDVLARLPEWGTDDPAELGGREEETAALTVEAFMLAHHAGESLLRHFFAQSPGWSVAGRVGE